MAYVNIIDIQLVGPNPSLWTDNFRFQIDFESVAELKDDLEWKILYVGSAENEENDQVLTSVLVGPIPVGRNRFELEAPPPDTSKIPGKDAIGITAVLLTCSYVNQEFVRVGYYVNNEYDNLEMRENPPKTPEYSRISRNTLIAKPRVTRFPINWDINPTDPNVQLQQYFYPPPENMIMSEASNSVPMMEDLNEEIGFGSLRGSVKMTECFPDFTEILTPELSKKIFQHLFFEELAPCRRVSKRWRQIIEEGVNWIAIDLRLAEWNEQNEQNNLKMLEFLVTQSSVQLEELLVPHSPITSDLLTKWIAKSGSSIKKIDLRWCYNLNSSFAINTLMNGCPNLSEIYLSYIGTDEAIENEQIAIICSKYQSTLTALTAHGITNDALRIIRETIGKNIRVIGAPNSEVNDLGIMEFVSHCPHLETLYLEWSDVTMATVLELRKRFTVKSTVCPDDFTVELTAAGELVEIGIRVKGWSEEITSEELGLIRKLLPAKTAIETDSITMEGNIETVNKALRESGFTDIVVSKIDDEEIDEDVCDICRGTENGDELLQCEQCEKSFHLYCLNPPLKEMPESEWFCEQCDAENNRTKRRKM